MRVLHSTASLELNRPVAPEQIVISRLVLQRFRSIPSACITFDNPTIFVGRNGSGKSNLISAFSFLADAMTAPLRTVIDRAGGISAVRNRSSGRGHPPKVGMRVDLTGRPGIADSSSYAFEIRPAPNHGFSVSREQCVVRTGKGLFWFDREGAQLRSNVSGLTGLSIDEASLILPLAGSFTSFGMVWRALADLRVYAIDPRALGKMQEPDPGFVLRPDGGNAASVLREIEKQAPRTFALIGDVLSTIVPNLDGVSVKANGKNLTLQFTQQWGAGKPRRLKFDSSDMSHGTLRALGILAALFQPRPAVMIAIEEPEATIHPGALESILDVLQTASRSTQIVITTHSPELLDAKWITSRHLRLVDWREGATDIAPVSEANWTALQEHLMGAGELLRANALEPASSDGASCSPPELFESV